MRIKWVVVVQNWYKLKGMSNVKYNMDCSCVNWSKWKNNGNVRFKMDESVEIGVI